MPSIHTEELRGSPGSYWCLPRELVRCRTLFRGASPPGFFFLNAWGRLVMRIWFAQRRWHLELLELVYSFCCAKSRKILEYGNCRSHSRAPQVLGLIGNAVTETDTWCGNLWTSHSLRGTATMQCSMVDECGAMKRTLWWQRKHTADVMSIATAGCMDPGTQSPLESITRRSGSPSSSLVTPAAPGPKFPISCCLFFGMPLDSYFGDSWLNSQWDLLDFHGFPTISHFFFDKVFWVVCLDRAAIYSDIICVYNIMSIIYIYIYIHTLSLYIIIYI